MECALVGALVKHMTYLVGRAKGCTLIILMVGCNTIYVIKVQEKELFEVTVLVFLVASIIHMFMIILVLQLKSWERL